MVAVTLLLVKQSGLHRRALPTPRARLTRSVKGLMQLETMEKPAREKVRLAGDAQ